MLPRKLQRDLRDHLRPLRLSSCRTALLTLQAGLALALSGAADMRAEKPPVLEADVSPLPSPQGGGQLFRPRDPGTLGVTFQAAHTRESREPYAANGGGIAIADFDGDGMLDIYFCSPTGSNRLYRQTAPWKFEDVTGTAGVACAEGIKSGAVFFDANNDGLPDLYVCRFDGEDFFFLNKGNGTFAPASESGFRHQTPSIMAYPCDVDRDGDLDLLVITHRPKPAAASPTALMAVDRKAGIAFESGERDLLYINEGGGRFTEQAEDRGLNESSWNALAAHWWDVNADGWPDLHVSNALNGPDKLFLNRGDGTFREVASYVYPHTPVDSAGVDSADFNGDGFLDLFIAGKGFSNIRDQAAHEPPAPQLKWLLARSRPAQKLQNALLLQSGAGPFIEAAHYAGVATTGETRPVWAGDFDLDGRADLLLVSWPHASRHGSPSSSLRLLRNTGSARFESVPSGLETASALAAIAVADLDGDGDEDIVANAFEGAPLFYENLSTHPGRIVIETLDAKGRPSSADITLRLRGTSQAIIHRTHARGYLSAAAKPIVISTGSASSLEYMSIEWPSGAVGTLTNAKAGNRYRVKEPSPPKSVPQPVASLSPSRIAPFLTEASGRLGLSWQHQSGPADLELRQAFVPVSPERAGPQIATGDVDGDGLIDFFIGGGELHPGAVFRQSKTGMFELMNQTALEFDSNPDQQGAAWFDLEGDGDLDLYVASGGTGRTAEFLKDRLYLNDGTGVLSPAGVDLHPALAGPHSVVAAADFDQDGDVDLFVGGTSIPGRYPEAAPSILLENHGGKLRDATPLIAPELSSVGIVTGAAWADLNGDGKLELVISTDWGPIRIFRNASGVLVEETDSRIPKNFEGRWSSLAAADIDNDGDIDLICGNRGINSRQTSGADTPNEITLWVNNEREAAAVLTYEGVQTGFAEPIGFLLGRVTAFRERYASPSLLASADLDSLKTVSNADALSRKAHVHHSVVLINDGKGMFTAMPLPWEAQLAPVTAILVHDWNSDGKPDLLLAENSRPSGATAEPVANGLGLMLLGGGTGHFQTVSAAESGLIIPSEGRALAILPRPGMPSCILYATHAGPLFAFLPGGPLPALQKEPARNP